MAVPTVPVQANSPSHWSPAAPEARQSSSHGALRVLLIERHEAQAETIGAALRALRIQCVWVRRGGDGLAALRASGFDLVLIDLDLADMSGMEFLRSLHPQPEGTRFIVISSAVALSVVIEIEGESYGARSAIEQPVEYAGLRVAVTLGLGRSGAWPAISIVRRTVASGTNDPPVHFAPAAPAARASSIPISVAERWALLVLNAVYAEHDPRTLSIWARSVGVSRSVLGEYCRLVHVAPRDARDFTRLLRAVHRCGETWQPETVLDLADARTLKKLLARAGYLEPIPLTPSPQEFLDRQQWIPKDNPGLRALERLLRPPPDGGDSPTN